MVRRSHYYGETLALLIHYLSRKGALIYHATWYEALTPLKHEQALEVAAALTGSGSVRAAACFSFFLFLLACAFRTPSQRVEAAT